MPREAYDQGVPSVAPSGPSGNDYLRIDAPIGAFGGLQAAALQKSGSQIEGAGNDLTQTAVGLQDFHNRAAVQDATNQALNIGQQELYDPDKGYLTSQGKGAMEGFQPTMDRIRQGFQTIRGDLQNDAQRISFDQDARRYLFYYEREAGSHADQQSKAWYNQTDNATLDQSIATSATSWNNPDMTAANLDRGYAALTSRSQREGWDPVTFADQTRKFESGLAVAQLRAQSITDPAGAMKRYNEGVMPGPAFVDPQTGRRTRTQIPFKDVIDESGKESLIRPLQRQMETDAIAGNSQVAIGGASPIEPVITSRAISAGIDPSVPLTIAKIESNLGQAPDAAGNSHMGVFQLGPDEWRQIGGTAANRTDKVAQATLGTDWVVGAQRAASAALGRPAAGWETYVVHQQGTQGGADLLIAQPTESAVDALAPAYKGDRAAAARAITNNGGSADMTVGQFLGLWQAKYATAAASLGGAGGAPPPVVIPPLGASAPMPGDAPAAPAAAAPAVSNLHAADAALSLTPQEKFLYQQHLGHLAGQDGGVIRQPNGATSTLLQTSQEHEGRFYNVPTVWSGAEHSEDQAVQHAAQVGWDKYPSYSTREAAEARYQQMHPFMERDIQQAAAPAQLTPLGSHNPAAYDMEAQMVANAVARAKQQFPDRPDLWEKQAEDTKRQIMITNTLQSQHDAAAIKQKKDIEEAAENDYVPQIITDPLHVDLKTMANDTRLSDEKRAQMAGMLRSSLHDEGKIAAVSHQEAAGLLTRIRAPSGDPTRVTDLGPLYKAYEGGNLTNADFAFVKNEFTSLQTPEGEKLNDMTRSFLTAVKPSIDKSNPLMGQLDMTGGSSFYRLQQDLAERVTEYRRGGKNPYDLLTPGKPDFIGSPENLAQYQHSIPQTMEQIRQQYAPASAAPAGGSGVSTAPAVPAVPRGQGGLVYPFGLGRFGATPGNPLTWNWHFAPAAPGRVAPAQPTPPKSLDQIFARPAAPTP